MSDQRFVVGQTVRYARTDPCSVVQSHVPIGTYMTVTEIGMAGSPGLVKCQFAGLGVDTLWFYPESLDPVKDDGKALETVTFLTSGGVPGYCGGVSVKQSDILLMMIGKNHPSFTTSTQKVVYMSSSLGAEVEGRTSLVWNRTQLEVVQHLLQERGEPYSVFNTPGYWPALVVPDHLRTDLQENLEGIYDAPGTLQYGTYLRCREGTISNMHFSEKEDMPIPPPIFDSTGDYSEVLIGQNASWIREACASGWGSAMVWAEYLQKAWPTEDKIGTPIPVVAGGWKYLHFVCSMQNPSEMDQESVAFFVTNNPEPPKETYHE